MHLTSLPCLAALLASAASAAAPQGGPSILLINEIRIDQVGADNDEYAELFSIPSNASLAGYSYLVIGDGAGGSGSIEAVIDLDLESTNNQGLLLIGEATMTIGTPDVTTFVNFENSDNVTHMVVEGFTGALGDDLDTDDDGVLDVTPWTAIADAVSLVKTVTPDTMAGEEFYYAGSLGFCDIGPDGSFVPAHSVRCLTSLMDWRVSTFQPLGQFDTPGAFNAPCGGGVQMPFCEPAAPNSVSATGGFLSTMGSLSISQNDTTLVANTVPDFAGVFVQADMMMPQAPATIGGNFCLTGQVQRMNMILIASGNQASLPLDFTNVSLAESTTAVGMTMYYQFFHRDTVTMGGGNFTAGIEITWAP